MIEDNGLRYYDYGARMYDPMIGRWGVVDPLADLAPEWTPYRFAFNNPLTYIDPTGLFETRAEAKEYRKEHGISGRIQKGSDGIFAIILMKLMFKMEEPLGIILRLRRLKQLAE
ncbi:RHS repeat domain-containing protein [Lunatibacter salilacus]|uniref:RHS repeat domain-containing protein n=1 Tax=Lunatibacter salilacus TaxID=2483804 RepID=UPI00293B92E5|nr:RHS repeat-associated core domain-containing protein [Lunatibacter salilacus]